MSRVLVIRLSALGDVAMLIPVLYSVAVRYPEDEFTLITKSPLIPIFERRPKNVSVVPVYTKDAHKGIRGLWKLIGELNLQKFDQVADLHNVLRSRQIDFFFRLKGKKVAIIDKGREEKRALTRKKNKNFHPLPSSFKRYQKVFNELGYDVSPSFQTLLQFGGEKSNLPESFEKKNGKTWIGIAPFAKHQGKTYPLEQMQRVVEIFNSRPEVQIFLFGGKNEAELLETWANRYEHVTSVVDRFSFAAELELMSFMDVMLTMDSGNMHLASLVQVPVVSVWGATHPFAGFYGYGQDTENAVQVDLFCRPCSIFGEKPCYRHNYECLHSISPAMIVEKVDRILIKKKNENSR